jgi:hypothetical protein
MGHNTENLKFPTTITAKGIQIPAGHLKELFSLITMVHNSYPNYSKMPVDLTMFYTQNPSVQTSLFIYYSGLVARRI